MFPCRKDWWRLALVLSVVFLGAGLRFGTALLSSDTEIDLAIYRNAFEHLEVGRSPYLATGYLYTPAFAVAGARVSEALGWWGFLLAFRGASLVGIALLVWASLAGSSRGWKAQAAVALGVAVSPLVASGIGCGNATPLFIGPVAVALLTAGRWPVLAGVVSGSLNALKPLAVPAVAISGRVEGGGGWRWRFLIATAAASLLAVLPGAAFLPDMLARSGGFPDAFFNLSLARAFGLLGLELHPAAVFAIATLAGTAVAWRFARNERERMAIGLATSLFGLPVVSTSAFLLSIPLQVMAFERVIASLREARQVGAQHSLAGSPWTALALISAVIVSIHGAEGAAGGSGDALHGLVLLIPFADVALLGAYVLRRPPDGQFNPARTTEPKVPAAPRHVRR